MVGIMVNYDSGIDFGGEEIPIVTGKDKQEYLKDSHKIAVWGFTDGSKYTIRGKVGFGFFAIERNS